MNGPWQKLVGLVLAVALVAAAASGLWRLNRPFPDYDQWFVAQISDGAMVIDARGSLSYSRGHIPGAPRLWSRDFLSYSAALPGILKTSEEISAILSAIGLAPDQEVVVYDQGTGADAPLVALVLTSMGVSVRVLDGGFDAWLAAGGTPSKDPVAPAAAVSPGDWAIEQTTLVSTEIVQGAQSNEAIVLADARGEIDFAIGHLEMAVSVSAGQMAPSGALPRWSEAAWVVDPVGVLAETSVMVYGTDLAEAARTWLSLRAYGIDNVTVFAGPFQVLATAGLPMEVPVAGAPVRASSVCFGAPVAGPR
ncbi:MAG: hypothetical protein HOB82_00405 [Alphaproteobacteria bacterium]|jgi:thiosulfate/3-mercaptopyruvate sulfurtransferase|nr:hypothetical protein [Alphaproteobacteria bacterium]MBT5859863.1 hypothetical protein [Alphaproteobacteria bacterium]